MKANAAPALRSRTVTASSSGSSPSSSPSPKKRAANPPDPAAASSDAAQPMLYALDGKRAPHELAQALRSLDDVPAGARARLEDVVLPCLEAIPEEQLEARMGRLCRRLDVAPEAMAPAIRACVFLFRHAAAVGLDATELGSDLDALGAAAHRDRLVALYREVAGSLRKEVARASLVGHGRVLTGVDWRVDTISSSSHGRRLNLPLALLTLHVQDGARMEHYTVQALPETLAELRAVCDRLLSR